MGLTGEADPAPQTWRHQVCATDLQASRAGRQAWETWKTHRFGVDAIRCQPPMQSARNCPGGSLSTHDATGWVSPGHSPVAAFTPESPHLAGLKDGGKPASVLQRMPRSVEQALETGGDCKNSLLSAWVSMHKWVGWGDPNKRSSSKSTL